MKCINPSQLPETWQLHADHLDHTREYSVCIDGVCHEHLLIKAANPDRALVIEPSADGEIISAVVLGDITVSNKEGSVVDLESFTPVKVAE